MPFFEGPHCVRKIVAWIILSIITIGAIVFIATVLLPNQLYSLLGPIVISVFALVWALMQKFGNSFFRAKEYSYSKETVDKHKKDVLNKEAVRKALNNQ